MKRVLTALIQTVLPPLALFAFVAAIWQWFVVTYRIKPYLLP